MFSKKQTILIKDDLYQLSTPKIMGILNVTPDSFYDGGKYVDEAGISTRIDTILAEGADMIDIGGLSTRPGAKEISSKEEKNRLKAALTIIQQKNITIPVSIDTYRADVADWAITNYKVDIINDISGGTFDKEILSVVSQYNIPLVIMHTKDKPDKMQQNISYVNVTKELIYDVAEKVEIAKAAGVKDIIIDPGFGFGKDLDQNYELLANLNVFNHLGLPILVGISRKSMIYKLLGSTPEESLNGTTILHTLALQGGADILRVHDVKEACESIKLFLKVKEKLTNDTGL